MFPAVYLKVQTRSQRTFSAKGQIVSIFSFAGQTASVVSPQLCHCGMKAAIDGTQKNEHGCGRVPIKLYLQR